MSKILLVEDDNNLREIFDMRLQAEGYQTVTAGDGEEALTVAMREKPDLIIADVMMPRLSGFEMLETLRATPDMASTKVIMMTALGQAEDRARGEKLGVVKYLVKSQVTLEDFVGVVRDVLQPGQGFTDTNSSPQTTDAAQTSGQENNNKESGTTMPEDNTNAPVPPADNGGATPPTNPMADAPASDAPAGDVNAAAPASTSDQQDAVQSQINDFVASAPAEPAAPAPATDAGEPALGTETPAAPAPETPAAPAPEAPAEGGDQPPAAPETPSEPPAGV